MDAQQQQRAAAPRPPRPPAGSGGGGDFTAIFTVLLMFLTIATMTVLLMFLATATMIIVPSSSTLKQSLSIVHQVPEGHVGVYWRGGALLKTITDPGFHLKMPLLTHFEPIQVTLQTDLVRDIPCGTKGGVMTNFEKIEVVNRLHKDHVYATLLNYGVQYDNTWIYDKIHHKINQFCSVHSLQQVYVDMFDQIGEKMKDALQADCTRYAPGIEIISVHVTRPTIPDSVRQIFVQVEEERTKVLIAMEKQRVAEKEAETLKKIAIIEAEKHAHVSKIQMEQTLMEQRVAENEAETQKKIAISEAEKHAHVSKIQMEQKVMETDNARRQEQISNEMSLARKKSLADAEYYRTMKEAESNKLKLTSKFFKLKFIGAISQLLHDIFWQQVPAWSYFARSSKEMGLGSSGPLFHWNGKKI